MNDIQAVNEAVETSTVGLSKTTKTGMLIGAAILFVGLATFVTFKVLKARKAKKAVVVDTTEADEENHE